MINLQKTNNVQVVSINDRNLLKYLTEPIVKPENAVIGAMSHGLDKL